MFKRVMAILLAISVMLCLAGCFNVKNDVRGKDKNEVGVNSAESDVSNDESQASNTEEGAETNSESANSDATESKEEKPEIQKNTQLCDYIGKSATDVKTLYGSNFTHGYFTGSACMVYENKRTLFLFDVDLNTDFASGVVHSVMSLGTEKVIGNLCGNMTYPQILSSVGSEVNVGEPEHFYNQMDEVWEYFLRFNYRGYNVSFTWYEDPNTNASHNCYVSK